MAPSIAPVQNRSAMLDNISTEVAFPNLKVVLIMHLMSSDEIINATGTDLTIMILQDLLYEEELLRNPFSLKMW